MGRINIGRFEVGGERTFIYAEIGSNHNQDFTLAKETIDAAKESGADAVKFQSLNVDQLYYSPSDDIQALHRRIDLAEDWHYTLNNYCKDQGILFFSAPTYLDSIKILEEINVPLYKIASAQAGTFPQLVKRVAQTGKPTLFSTGITNVQEVDNVVAAFRAQNNEQFIVLHCNSMYPTPYENVNLGMIEVYRQRYGNPVGYSDHTDDVYTAMAAVAKGASVIEKHFTLSKNLPVPDAPFSLIPDKFSELVEGVRAAELSIRDLSRENIEEAEQVFKDKILYRLVLKHDKKQGDKFEESDFDFKRHPEGVDCREMDEVINQRVASLDISAGSVLTYDDLAS